MSRRRRSRKKTMKIISDIPKERVTYKDGVNPSRDLNLWNKKGGSYSRKQLLNVMFYTENETMLNNNSSSSSSGVMYENVRKDGRDGRFDITSYSNWFLSFYEPVLDHRNSGLSKRKIMQMYNTDEIEAMNEKKEPFSLFAVDFSNTNSSEDEGYDIFESNIHPNQTEIKRGAFFIIRKKVRDMYTSGEEFDCFWLMIDSRSDTIGSYGDDLLNVVEISPKILHSFFPEPTINQMKSFTKYHPVSKMEIRIREGNYKKMLDHVITSENRKLKFSKKNSRKSTKSKSRKICIEKVYRSGRTTTGRMVCSWN